MHDRCRVFNRVVRSKCRCRVAHNFANGRAECLFNIVIELLLRRRQLDIGTKQCDNGREVDSCFLNDEISGGKQANDGSVGIDDGGTVDITHEHGPHRVHHVVPRGKGQDIADHDLTNRQFSQHRSSKIRAAKAAERSICRARLEDER